MLEIGQLIDGKYKILNVIGKGGMSVVYLAMNEKAGKQWAIKEVRKDGKQDFNVVKQGLVAELGMLKRLNHPNLPSIIDVIDGEDTFLIVMDYIEGISLEQRLREKGAQSQDDVIKWAKELCDVLGYLHSRVPPIIYRDMKPANVMLKPDGSVTLIDFGTAREFKDTSVEDTTCLGTRGYAAPEQFGGQGQTDARTDIYCLGATMYHLITGHNPSSPPYEMYPIRQWNSLLSPALEEIILICTQQNPAARYQTCAELMVALDDIPNKDSGVMEKQHLKWKLFLGSVITTAFMAVGALTFGLLENSKNADTYEAYLANAKKQTTEEAIFEYYNNAIALQPQTAQAYEEMLDYAMMDMVFTESEAAKILEVMSNETYSEQFRKASPAEYAHYCYELGTAYYFSYIDPADGVQRSARWFDAAHNIAEFGADADYEKEEVLRKMSSVSTWGVTLKSDGTIDPESSYEAYWKDISLLGNMDMLGTETVSTTLSMYKKFAVVLYSDALDFARSSGAQQEDIHKLLDRMKVNITTQNLSRYSTYVAQIHDDQAYDIDRQIEMARQKIDMAYNSVNNDFTAETEAGTE